MKFVEGLGGLTKTSTDIRYAESQLLRINTRSLLSLTPWIQLFYLLHSLEGYPMAIQRHYPRNCTLELIEATMLIYNN